MEKVREKNQIFSKKGLTFSNCWYIMAKLSGTHAAIAQQVERILGKDEVASSNLASSSKPNRKVRFFLFLPNNK